MLKKISFQEMIQIEQLSAARDILVVLQECRDALYDQRINDANVLKKQAWKFFEHGVFRIAILEGKVVGFIAYYRNNEVTKVAFVSMFAVKPGERCCGVGSALISAMEEDCQRLGFKIIRLEVAETNNNAIEFYQRKGYVKASNKDEMILMEKRFLREKE